jgi:hypothetical protein
MQTILVNRALNLKTSRADQLKFTVRGLLKTMTSLVAFIGLITANPTLAKTVTVKNFTQNFGFTHFLEPSISFISSGNTYLTKLMRNSTVDIPNSVNS